MSRRNWMIGGAALVSLTWLSQSVDAADRLKVAMMDQQLVIERSVAGERALEDLKS